MTTARRADSTMPRIARHPASFDLIARRVYMVGIGGCGMSGLARLLRSRGAIVAGSDSTPSPVTDSLAAEGIRVDLEQTAALVPEACDLLITSAAIKPDNPQVLEADRRGIRMMLYAEALGACMMGRTGVAIAGTHGKSTTTAMLGAALVDAGLDPSVIVGATCAQLAEGCVGQIPLRKQGPAAEERDSGRAGGSAESLASASGAESLAHARGTVAAGFRLGADRIPAGALAGQPGILIAEACEFNRSFHNFWPTVACITSVEADHLDVYGSLEAVIEAFHEFALLLPPARAGGRLLIAHDGAHRREVTAGVQAAVETIGFAPEADWVVRWDVATRRVELQHHGSLVAAWTNVLPGQHNAMNAATAVALGVTLGADPARLAASLSAFRGVDRRMQFLGEVRSPDWTEPQSSASDARRACGSAQACDETGAPDMAVGGDSHATRSVRWAPASSVRVFDDYGHHPTEIDATLRALRLAERPEQRTGPTGLPGRLICVFQPHQHSRTRHLLDEFATSFEQADIVIVPHIYFVRDSIAEKAKVSAADLVDRLRQRGLNALHLYPFEAIVEHLQNLCRPGDTLCVMGAGPVNEVAYGYINAMRTPRRDARKGSGPLLETIASPTSHSSPPTGEPHCVGVIPTTPGAKPAEAHA